jgi:hypothetical protein
VFAFFPSHRSQQLPSARGTGEFLGSEPNSRVHGLAIKTNPTFLTIQAFLITTPVTVIALKDKNKAEYKKNVMIQKSKINHRPGHEVLHFDVSRKL